MNKTELVTLMATKTGMTKKKASEALEAFMEAVTETLASGEKIPLVGFGTFYVSDRSARTARNPKDGKEIKIAAKKLARFKVGKKLDEAVNKK